MKYLSLFSGIEAASVAWEPLGFEPVAFSEFDAFPSAVLAHRFPHVPNHGDVTKITEEQIKSLGRIDIVVFGSPCQDLSVAGLRKGFSGERSGLFYVAIRIVQWARKHCGCRFALWENVFGAFSSNQGRDFAAVVEQMAGCRDVTVPANGWGSEGAAVGDLGLLEWGTLDAQWFGVAQRRRRVFALADFGDWANRPPVLLEPHRLRRDTPPRRGKGPTVAALTANGVGTCGADDNQGQAGHLICMAHGQGGAEIAGDRSPALTCNHEAPIVFHPTQDPISSTDGTTHAMGCGSSGGQASVAVAVSLRGREGGATAELGDEVGGCLRASGGGGDKAHVLAPVAFLIQEVGKRTGQSTTDKRAGIGIGAESDPMFTLQAGAQHGVAHKMAVRRLTPRECERLQGFPDDYTLVEWYECCGDRFHVSLGKHGCPNCEGDKEGRLKTAADGPRYKALGNSMAVPVMRWIGSRIKMVLEWRAAA